MSVFCSFTNMHAVKNLVHVPLQVNKTSARRQSLYMQLPSWLLPWILNSFKILPMLKFPKGFYCKKEMAQETIHFLFQNIYPDDTDEYIQFYLGTESGHFYRSDNIVIRLETTKPSTVVVKDLYVCACYTPGRSYDIRQCLWLNMALLPIHVYISNRYHYYQCDSS